MGHDAAEDAVDFAEGAVGDGEGDLLGLAEDGDRGGGAEGLAVEAQEDVVAVAGVGVGDHDGQVGGFADGVGTPGGFIFTVAAEVVGDAVEAQVQVNFHIFKVAVAVVREAVGQEDKAAAFDRVFEIFGVELVAVVAFDGVGRALQAIDEGDVVVVGLPFDGLIEGLAVAVEDGFKDGARGEGGCGGGYSRNGGRGGGEFFIHGGVVCPYGGMGVRGYNDIIWQMLEVVKRGNWESGTVPFPTFCERLIGKLGIRDGSFSHISWNEKWEKEPSLIPSFPLSAFSKSGKRNRP